MKKRLRKKKHQDEFGEWGRQLVITRNTKDGFDEFLDAFIENAIEANGCYCGGGGKEDSLDVVVELGRMADGRDGGIRAVDPLWVGHTVGFLRHIGRGFLALGPRLYDLAAGARAR